MGRFLVAQAIQRRARCAHWRKWIFKNSPTEFHSIIRTFYKRQNTQEKKTLKILSLSNITGSKNQNFFKRIIVNLPYNCAMVDKNEGDCRSQTTFLSIPFLPFLFFLFFSRLSFFFFLRATFVKDVNTFWTDVYSSVLFDLRVPPSHKECIHDDVSKHNFITLISSPVTHEMRTAQPIITETQHVGLSLAPHYINTAAKNNECSKPHIVMMSIFLGMWTSKTFVYSLL